ncbi:MAG: YaiI/YqxD family protein [Pseudomonadota bacterium]
MAIWVDADACPRVIKELLYRAADRTQTVVTFVANQPLSVPRSPYVKTEQVPAGFDVADHRIVEAVQVGELVITADIPLAAAVVEKGAEALNPRGEHYTPENVRQRLAVRDLMDELRGVGLAQGGPPPLSDREKQVFANALDRYLTASR